MDDDEFVALMYRFIGYEPPSWWHRNGWWVIIVAVLIYAPLALWLVSRWH